MQMPIQKINFYHSIQEMTESNYKNMANADVLSSIKNTVDLIKRIYAVDDKNQNRSKVIRFKDK